MSSMAEHNTFQKLVAEAKKKITEISPAQAAAKSKSGEAVIVDVREEDEWDEEHIPDAIHMSRGIIELDVEGKIPDTNAMIICHCGGGGTVSTCGRELAKNGVQKCPLHGWRVESLESRRFGDNHIICLRLKSLHKHQFPPLVGALCLSRATIKLRGLLDSH